MAASSHGDAGEQVGPTPVPGVVSSSDNYCRFEAAVGLMESGTDVLAIPGRLGCLMNWQDAKLIPASEPRKLLASVRLRSKHGSNGIPRITAQMDSPRTRRVPGGSVA